MLNVISSVFSKNRQTVKRTYPISFIMQRIIGGVGSIVFPVFIYVFVFESSLLANFSQHTNTKDYITYITLGVSMNILSFSTLMNVGRCLISEIREGTLDTFLLSPAPRIAYFIGAYLEQFLRSCFEFLVVIILGTLLGAKIPMTVSFFLLIIIASLSFFSVSMLLSTIMVVTRDTYLTQNTLFTLMAFLCGVSFPIEFLPQGVRSISNIFPLTHVLKLLRRCVLDNQSILDNLELLCVTIIISVVFFALGYFIYIFYEKKLVEDVYS